MSQIVHTNLEIVDWFASLTDKVDVWITDPPYPFDSQNGTNRYDGMYKRMDWKDLETTFSSMFDNTNAGGRAYVFCNRDGIEQTKKALEKAGWRFLNLLVWDKMHFGGGYHWRNQLEYIVYVSKGKPATYVQGLPNIFKYKRPSKSDSVISIGYNVDGQSCKPMQIWTDILINGAKQDEIVADPFAGSNPMRASVLTNSVLSSKIQKVYTNTYST